MKPDVALTETRKLVERDRVHLLAGVLGSGFPFGAYVKAKLGYRQLVVAYADYAAGQDMSSGSSRTSRRRGRERGIFPEGDPIVRLYADSIVTQAAE